CGGGGVGTFSGVSLSRPLWPDDDLDARAATYAAGFARPIAAHPSRPPAPAVPTANYYFVPDPGYYWANSPSPVGSWSGGLNLFGAIPGQAIEAEDGSLIFTYGHRTDPRLPAIRSYRPVIFDAQRRRYLPRWERGASSTGNQGDLASVDHFRLDPQILASDRVAYVGVERMSFETRRLTVRHVTGAPGPGGHTEPATDDFRQPLSAPDYSWSI